MNSAIIQALFIFTNVGSYEALLAVMNTAIIQALFIFTNVGSY